MEMQSKKNNTIAINAAIAEMAGCTDRYVRMILSGKRASEKGKARKVKNLIRLQQNNPAEFFKQYYECK